MCKLLEPVLTVDASDTAVLYILEVVLWCDPSTASTKRVPGLATRPHHVALARHLRSTTHAALELIQHVDRGLAVTDYEGAH